MLTDQVLCGDKCHHWLYSEVTFFKSVNQIVLDTAIKIKEQFKNTSDFNR